MDLEIIKIASNTDNNNILKDYTHIAKHKNPLCGDEITQQMNSDSGEIFLNVKCDCKRILKVVKKDEFEFCWNFFSNQQIDEIESGYLNYILLKMRRGQSVRTLSVDSLNTNDRDLYRITDVRVID